MASVHPKTLSIGFVLLLSFGVVVGAFTSSSRSSPSFLVPTSSRETTTSVLSMSQQRSEHEDVTNGNDLSRDMFAGNNRRSFLTTTASSFGPVVGFLMTPIVAFAADDVATEKDDESFASIAARASSLSRDAGEKSVAANMGSADGDNRTAYDFDLPIGGDAVRFEQIIRQSVDEETGRRTSRVKVILVANIKEDDPIARKDIPEFISLASTYGRSGEFAVVVSPSDQGYYEPDTSQLIRLKLASEYGFGINPAIVVTDKVNLLGKGAHPFWRWLQKNCRTPAGLGRIEGNFEKFLIDGRTGLPLRRYPRRYKPLDIKNDIEAILAGLPLPPAGANFFEQWRSASVEAERDTYRFQKGLNYYD